MNEATNEKKYVCILVLGVIVILCIAVSQVGIGGGIFPVISGGLGGLLGRVFRRRDQRLELRSIKDEFRDHAERLDKLSKVSFEIARESDELGKRSKLNAEQLLKEYRESREASETSGST